MVGVDPAFCPTCGTALETRHVEGRDRSHCPACDRSVWRNPVPTAGVAVVDRGTDPAQVLLVRRSQPPGTGMWGLPAGFVEYGEQPRAAAARELHEETGVQVDPAVLVLLDVDDLTHPSDRHLVTISYTVSRAQTTGDPVAGSDALDARFWALDSLGAAHEAVRPFDQRRVRRAIDTV